MLRVDTFFCEANIRVSNGFTPDKQNRPLRLQGDGLFLFYINYKRGADTGSAPTSRRSGRS
jgi:hypothetical protein